MTYGKLLRRLCGTVLIMEAVIMLLTIVPAMKFEHGWPWFNRAAGDSKPRPYRGKGRKSRPGASAT